MKEPRCSRRAGDCALSNARLSRHLAFHLLEQSRHPIQVVAQETGFVDIRRVREAFLRTFGLPPQAFRRNARERAA